jgi:antitoxin (DNA-binding transcriptional repressor) of toxin-antitoxin stability system
MKKISAREFQHGFSKHAQSLKPGQSVMVTNHGKPVGVFTKTGPSRAKAPNFLAALEKFSYSPQQGQRVIEAMLSDAVL